MSQYEDIEEALQDELANNLGTGWDFKKPGKKFTPDVTRPYAKGSVIMGRPSRVAVGGGGYYRTIGIFQIDLHYPTKLQEVRGLQQKLDALSLVFFPANHQGRVISDLIVCDKLPSQGPLDESDDAHTKRNLDVFFYVDSPPE